LVGQRLDVVSAVDDELLLLLENFGNEERGWIVRPLRSCVGT